MSGIRWSLIGLGSTGVQYRTPNLILLMFGSRSLSPYIAFEFTEAFPEHLLFFKG